MSKISDIQKRISQGDFDEIFKSLYGKEAVSFQKKRYLEALSVFSKLYPDKTDIFIFSAPGRTEVSGNHTDHNNGKTLAAAIDLDVIAVASKEEEYIEVNSQGFSPDKIALCGMQYKEDEKNTSKALIKGICRGLKECGKSFGGFVAYTTSSVLKGSGISSSAAFEVLICTALNHLYNNGEIDAVTVAKISQYAENKFFGKPCGLLDQTACSVGGFITMDFEDAKEPKIEKIDFDFESSGYTLCIVDTGGNHADLTHEYAAIPNEMKAVASFFGNETLRGVKRAEICANAKALREKFGDRALLRALHFADENDRVDALTQALKEKDIESFLRYIRRSGRSSFMYLQNVYSSSNISEQGLSLALCISEGVLGTNGAYRVHGGGFGGTIQAFVPKNLLCEYQSAMDNVFGKGACKVLKIRPCGGVMITN